jgi:hypothetical protein
MNTSAMNLDLQVPIDNITEGADGMNTYTGLAWSRGEVLKTIEFSIDDGETWNEVVYESHNGSLTTYEAFQFQFSVNVKTLPEGYNVIIVRGIDSEGASSMISWDSVEGGGQMEIMGDGNSLGRILFISVVGLAIAVFGVWVFIHQRVEDPFSLVLNDVAVQGIPEAMGEEPLEAIIIEDDSEFTAS